MLARISAHEFASESAPSARRAAQGGQGARVRCVIFLSVPAPLPLNVLSVFVNAPHILAPAEMFAAPPTQLDSQGPAAGGPTAEEMQADEATALRGWWQPSKDGSVARGLEESIMSLREVLRGAVFDVRALYSGCALQMRMWCDANGVCMFRACLGLGKLQSLL